MRNLYFTINNVGFSIKDLEDQELNLAFIQLYRVYFTVNREYVEQEIDKLLPRLFELSENALSKRKGDFGYHDSYFENFTLFTETSWERGFSEQASRIWGKVAKFASDFEKTNFEIHKGSLYYFWSIPLLLLERIDAAILALHKGVLEDRKNKPNTWRGAPGNLVLTLSEVPGPYLREFLIDPVLVFIKERLTDYEKLRPGKISYQDLRRKFLDNDQVEPELQYYFTLSIIKLQYITRLDKLGLGDSTMAPLILTSSIGSMLLLWESLLRLKYKNKLELGKNLPLMLKDLQLKNVNLKIENNDRKSDFKKWLSSRLNKSLTEELMIGYGLRNQAFHSLESESLLWEKHTEVIRSVLNCFFATIEII